MNSFRTLIISTVVDKKNQPFDVHIGFRTLLISTVVDSD
jgi:hypothetical protein